MNIEHGPLTRSAYAMSADAVERTWRRTYDPDAPRVTCATLTPDGEYCGSRVTDDWECPTPGRHLRT